VRTVEVPLGQRSYRIRIAPNLLGRLGAECRRLKLGSRCAIISDTNVARRYAKPALSSLKRSGYSPILITVPAGERTKSLDNVQRCQERLAEHRLERGSFIVALGGGVVGDLAGFVAATYLRGISCVQVPTTLLAQVDSSVGGKTGVNLKGGKNLVGAFHQPRLVLCDLATLKTLPRREFVAGFGEIIKYGAIRDPKLLSHLERDLPRMLAGDPAVLGPVVARCCEIKAGIVARDEREAGLRAILNFGHTFGHALEAGAGYGRYMHGEAIAIGQAAAAWLSVQLVGLPEAQASRITGLLQRTGLPVSLRLSPARRKALLAAMRLDKKRASGRTNFVLIKRLGNAVPDQTVNDAMVNGALNHITQTKRQT
jgi:3-dehydroquinate synthase